MTHWKEQFDFLQQRVWQLPDKTFFDQQTINFIKDFITQTIEKIIDDIPNELGGINADGNRSFNGYSTSNLKQQLKDKWL